MLRTPVLILSALIVFGSSAYAAEVSTPAAQSAVAIQPKPKPRSPEEQKKLDLRRKKIGEMKKEINGSRWEVTVRSTSNPKEKEQKDTLLFQDDQMSSTNLEKRGFAKTNYTITVPDGNEETAVWETMKTGKDGIVFIRGEWQKDKMSGNLSEQLDGGKKTAEFYFTSDSRKAVPPQSKEEKETAEETLPKQLEKSNLKDSSSNALVSKEEKVLVAPFEPGTTDEIVSPKKSNKRSK